jgi:hypothetical protein
MRFPRAVRIGSLLIAVLLVSGCSSNNTGKIEGTWTSINSTIKGMNIVSGTAFLQFTKGGKLTFSANGRTWTGTYSLGMGDVVTMTFDKELAGRKSHHETVVIKDNLLTMIDSDGTRMSFVKEEKK